MLRAFALAAAALVFTACGNTHPLQDGSYAFTRGEVVRDDCGEASRPELMSGGALERHGHEVRFDTGFFNVKLVGQFLSLTERFHLDGSAANVVAQVEGRECLLDLVVLTMDAETIDPTSFSGTLSAQYQAERPVDCDCETWVRFSAVHQ
jgi:hypothetical protein